MEKYIGGPAGKVFLRLLIASLIVGMILSFLGLSPYHLVDSFINLARRIYDMGFDAIAWLFEYIILGAIIVVPFWLLSRTFNILGTSEEKTDSEKTDPTQGDTAPKKTPNAG